MSELVLLHSPADIAGQTLVDLSIGTNGGATPRGLWPVYVTSEAAEPDNAIFVTDTSPQDDGRSMVSGERWEHFGIQVKIRATTAKVGYTKAKTIQKAMDESIYGHLVNLDSSKYRVECFTKTRLLKLGKETPNSIRSLFTVNALVSITRLT